MIAEGYYVFTLVLSPKKWVSITGPLSAYEATAVASNRRNAKWGSPFEFSVIPLESQQQLFHIGDVNDYKVIHVRRVKE